MTNLERIVGLILVEARKHGLNYWNCNPSSLSYSQIEKYGLPEGQHGIESVLFDLFTTNRLDTRMKGQFSYYVSWVYSRMVRDRLKRPTEILPVLQRLLLTAWEECKMIEDHGNRFEVPDCSCMVSLKLSEHVDGFATCNVVE